MNLQSATEHAGEKDIYAHYDSAWGKLLKFRLSLSDLFVLVAFCAGLSLVYSQSWSLPSVSVLAISLSIAIGFFFVLGGLSKRNPTIMLVWLFLAGIILGCAGSIALFWVSAAHAAGAVVLCFVPKQIRTPRLLMRSSMAMIVLALIYWTYEKPFHLKQLLQAREDHPIADISNRLDFEHREQERSSSTQSSQPIELAANVEARLTSSESGRLAKSIYNYRAEQLEKIHGEKHEKFVRQLGFGIIRMGGIRSGLDTPDLPTIEFASALVAEKDIQWKWLLQKDDSEGKIELSELDGFSQLHTASEQDFLNPNMFGFIAKAKPDKVHVAGFVPHAFHDGLEVEHDSLQMKKLELVSLLKFEEPRAYVLDHLPRMDELSVANPKTRHLTYFENLALGQLQKDRDVVIEQYDDVILMMGALRAANHCLECHSGSRGELLGAFSYEFTTAD